MTVTIDGPACAGKGTIARAFARQTGFAYLDVGLLYRFCAWLHREAQWDPLHFSDVAALRAYSWDGQSVRLNYGGSSLLTTLSAPDIAAAASRLASDPAVHEQLRQYARAERARFGDCVCDGRNTGSTLFPEADWKFFVIASREVRARRRYTQLLDLGMAISFDEVLHTMTERDERDVSRSEHALVVPAHAIVLRSDELDVQTCVAKMMQYVGMS